MCTNFIINSKNREPVVGRSMEFGLDLGSEIFFRKPGHEFKQFMGLDPQFQFTWTGKYGFVAMGVGIKIGDLNLAELRLGTDGMNTEGLTVGSLWLPGTGYQTITNPAIGLDVDYFCNWVLSQFATCDEVKSALQNQTVQVNEASLKKGDPRSPLHFPIFDAKGNGIVIEFIDGQVQIHENPVGVCTNDPFFPWQLENLRNYVGVTPYDAGPLEIDGNTILQTGHGTGFIPLPGDSTPPSRFIRATMMKNFAYPASSPEETTDLAFHILNTVDIPEGTSRSKGGITGEEADYTQWVVVKDLRNLIFYTRFYDSPQVYSVDLKKINLEKADGKTIKVTGRPISIDLSGEV